ncbi:hypothetical protein TNCV_1834421 [Trichonephila clavipes]|nr:hypothetical protein TNCV_1834421 [Trichonephila clavipes]
MNTTPLCKQKFKTPTPRFTPLPKKTFSKQACALIHPFLRLSRFAAIVGRFSKEEGGEGESEKKCRLQKKGSGPGPSRVQGRLRKPRPW